MGDAGAFEIASAVPAQVVSVEENAMEPALRSHPIRHHPALRLGSVFGLA
jgi:hypothetical protein